MASETIGHASPEKHPSEGNAAKQGELDRDVEAAPEMIDVDRIEKVYA